MLKLHQKEKSVIFLAGYINGLSFTDPNARTVKYIKILKY